MKTKYITEADFQRKWNEAKTQAYKDKLSTIWKLSSRDWTMKRVSEKRWRMARDLYREIQHEWRLTDLELELDSKEATCGSKRHVGVQRMQQECIDKCLALAKALQLKPYCGTFFHIEKII